MVKFITTSAIDLWRKIMFQFVDVTEELTRQHQRQLQIDKEAPTTSNFLAGDRITCNLPSFEGVAVVIFSWYVLHWREKGHWRIKADVEQQTPSVGYRVWEGAEDSFNFLEI